MTLERTSVEPRIVNLDLKLSDGEEIVTWWYCGLVKNHRDNTQPLVLVCFRKIGPLNQLGAFMERRIPLTWLGQFRIGTIWKLQSADGRQTPKILCTEALNFSTQIFHVNFSHGTWKFYVPNTEIKNNGQSIIPESIYSLADSVHGNEAIVISFPFSNDSVGLIIPSIEFLSRCYGRSQYVTQTLSTYPWDIAQDRLFARGTTPAPPGTWGVNLATRSVNGDTVFLAHVKHDRYATRAAKNVYAEIATSVSNSRDSIGYPQIGPWFESSAQIKVKGLWIASGRRFLGLQILGCSEPDGVPIFRDRQNSNKMLTGPIEGNLHSNGSWNGIPPLRIRKAPEIVDLTGNEAPSHQGGTIQIDDPDFEVLGNPRIILDANHEKIERIDVRRRMFSDNSDYYSAGERSGSGKRAGLATFQAPAIMESSGALRDVWNALKQIKKENNSVIERVESFSPKYGFSDNAEPELMRFQEFSEIEKTTLETKVSNWPYIDTTTQAIRGALLARVTTTKGCYYFFEPQRRLRIKTEKSGEKKQGEESFRGLVFTLRDNTSLEDWVEKMMSQIRYSCGVVTNIINECPGRVATFNHTRPSANELPCERAIKKKLISLGLDFPSAKLKSVASTPTLTHGRL